jgi:hypothetical protein
LINDEIAGESPWSRIRPDAKTAFCDDNAARRNGCATKQIQQRD